MDYLVRARGSKTTETLRYMYTCVGCYRKVFASAPRYTNGSYVCVAPTQVMTCKFHQGQAKGSSMYALSQSINLFLIDETVVTK